MSSVRVLLVEDNDDLRDSLVVYFENENYIVQACASAEEAELYLDKKSFSIAIIDVNLPRKNGFELVASIRDRGLTIPLIALTARDSTEDKIRGFELGLTDYVVKPFSIAELVARMRAHLRIEKGVDLQSEHIILRPARREVEVNGVAIDLTATEFRMLEILLLNRNKIVETDDMIAHVWGEADRYSDPPLRIHIRNLRKKLHDDTMKLIKTVAGTGYMLND